MSDDAKNSFALHRHTTTVPVNADGTPKKEPNRLTPSTEEEKQAARTKILWNAKGHGKGTFIEAFCPICSLQMTFENVTLNAIFKHCGKKDRVPEKIYEMYCVLRDNDGRPRVPERPLKVRWF